MELASLTRGGKLARALIDEQSFLADLREGVARIASDPRAAADYLISAVEIRPERADVHLYVSAAMLRLGSESVAREALGRALELCPRALETSAGMRAAKLGLPLEKK